MAEGMDQEREGKRRGGPDGGGSMTTTLSGGEGCIAEARHLAAAFLAEIASGRGRAVPARRVDLIQLVVSELVTNACKYAPGPVLLGLRLTGEVIEVQVWDSDPVLPTVRAANPRRVGQHGLEIVRAVAVGLSARREGTGKRVTATLPLDEDAETAVSRPAVSSGRPEGRDSSAAAPTPWGA
ncbi:ATP-binding protein [Streptomyces sp. NPDC004561]